MRRFFVLRDRWTAAAAILTVATLHGPAIASPAPGLVAAYGFEEGGGTTTADASGNALTASLVGAAWTTQGKFGNGLTFDGVTAHVNTIHDAPELRLTSAVTLSAWVKPSVVTNAWRDIVEKGNDNYFLMATSQPNGRPAGGGIFNNVNTVVFGPTSVTVNVWTHLAMTYNGSTIRLYVNGLQVSSVSRTGAIKTSTSPLQIGGDNFYGQYFAGTIDEVRVYNRALSQAEIQTDMNTAVSSPVADSEPPMAPASLSATALNGMQNDLSWAPASDNVGVTRYRVDRCRGSGCSDFAEIAAAAGTAYSDTGLALNTPYVYRVRAVDAAGNLGPHSGAAEARTLTTTAVPGLVAAYSFDAGAGPSVADLSGTGNVGAIAGATWTGAGMYGNALAFNGTSSVVTIPDSPSLHLTTGMTLAAWCYPLSLPPDNCQTPNCHWMDIIVKSTDCYYLEASSDLGRLPEVGGIFAGQKRIIFGPSRLAIGSWTHITMTYDNVLLRLYVDGALVASTPLTGALLSSTQPLQIGADDVYGQHFNGTIDEVRVYNRGLSESEVWADMNTPIENPANNPTPATSGLAPSATAAGNPGFALTVLGVGFDPESLVEWNGATRATTFVSATELHAEIFEADIATAGTAQVTVFNAPPVGGTSNPRSFTICPGVEVCNGIDDDCDGLIDDADPSVAGRPTWYRDTDGDNFGDPASTLADCAQPAGYSAIGGDCDDANGTVWSLPGEADLLGFVDATTVTWAAPTQSGGVLLRYDTLRASSPSDFDDGGSCLESDGLGNTFVDTQSPDEGSAYYYLVRAENTCGEGSLGTAFSGFERTARPCP